MSAPDCFTCAACGRLVEGQRNFGHEPMRLPFGDWRVEVSIMRQSPTAPAPEPAPLCPVCAHTITERALGRL